MKKLESLGTVERERDVSLLRDLKNRNNYNININGVNFLNKWNKSMCFRGS